MTKTEELGHKLAEALDADFINCSSTGYFIIGGREMDAMSFGLLVRQCVEEIDEEMK